MASLILTANPSAYAWPTMQKDVRMLRKSVQVVLALSVYWQGAAAAEKSSLLVADFPFKAFEERADGSTLGAVRVFLADPGEVSNEKQNEGLVIYFRSFKRQTPEGPLAMAFEARVKIPLAKLASVWFSNWDVKPKWADRVECFDVVDESKKKEVSPGVFGWENSIRSLSTDFGFGIWRRVFVSRSSFVADCKERWIASISWDHPRAMEIMKSYQLSASDKHQLGKVYFISAYMKEEEPDQTLLQFAVKGDPQGSLPTSIVNLIAQSWPKTTFKTLTQFVMEQEGSYQVHDYF